MDVTSLATPYVFGGAQSIRKTLTPLVCYKQTLSEMVESSKPCHERGSYLQTWW